MQGVVRLLYVTPEKVAKSRWFLELMERLDEKNLFKRVIVDEAHCVS